MDKFMHFALKQTVLKWILEEKPPLIWFIFTILLYAFALYFFVSGFYIRFWLLLTLGSSPILLGFFFHSLPFSLKRSFKLPNGTYTEWHDQRLRAYLINHSLYTKSRISELVNLLSNQIARENQKSYFSQIYLPMIIAATFWYTTLLPLEANIENIKSDYLSLLYNLFLVMIIIYSLEKNFSEIVSSLINPKYYHKKRVLHFLEKVLEEMI